MIITVKNEINKQKILEEYKIITAFSSYGIGFFTFFSKLINNITGRENKLYEKKLNFVKEKVMNKLLEKAEKLNANAILNLKLEIKGLSIFAYGTACRIIPEE